MTSIFDLIFITMLNTRQIIALKEINGCGAATIRHLVEESRKMSQVNISNEDFLDFINNCIAAGIKRSRLKTVNKSDFNVAVSNADRILDESSKSGIRVTSYIDTSFPSQLLKTVNEDGKFDIPLVLYYKGDLSIASQNGIAIIGTREPTKEGLQAGEYFGEKLAEEGFNIISGLAIGCDTAGHRGALKYSKGKTTAFLAHGLDSIYPSENEELAAEILERGGLLMSEYSIGENVNRYNLVARDRLQAALANATIVIQTGINGGTNHAANTTLISGKPLFCVKYGDESIMNHEKVAGNKALVTKGAKYITSNDYKEKISLSIGTSNTNPSSCNSSIAKGQKELLLFNFDD